MGLNKKKANKRSAKMRPMKLALAAAMAVLALSPPAMASQGYMLSSFEHFDTDFANSGCTATGILPGASLTANDQEVMAFADSRVLGFTSVNELPAAEPAILGTIEETDTSPGASNQAAMNEFYALSASTGAGHFKGSVIYKLGHAAPAGSAGNAWIERFDAGWATANHTVLKIG